MPKMGTSKIYRAVMKPAFPAVVPAMPTCCSDAARKSTAPQTISPHTGTARAELHALTVEACSARRLSPEHLGRINGYLASARQILSLEAAEDGLRLRVLPEGSATERAVFRLAASFAEMPAEHFPDRIKLCGNPSRGWIFYDESKSRTRKWCGNTCAYPGQGTQIPGG